MAGTEEEQAPLSNCWCSIYSISFSDENGAKTDVGLNNDCSVSLLLSRLGTELEVGVRPLVLARVSSGVCVPGHSRVSKEKFGSSDHRAAEFGLYLLTLLRNPDKENGSVVAVAILHEELDFLEGFQTEIDQYFLSVESELVKEVFPSNLVDDWYSDCSLYIPRAVQILGPHLQFFIHAILSGKQPEFDWGEASDADWSKAERDLRRLAELCRVEELGADKFQITSGVDPSSVLCSVQTTTTFTNEWAQVLLNLVGGAASPQALKQLIVAFQLKATRDLNTFQRLLTAAENDHYALLSVLEFVRATRNESLLIFWAERLAETGEGQTRSILWALRDYLALCDIFRLMIPTLKRFVGRFIHGVQRLWNPRRLLHRTA